MMFGEQTVERNLSAPKGCTSDRAHVPLDDIERFAATVEHQTRMIEQFCARFFGEPTCSENAPCTPVPSGYNGQLTRVGNALDELVKAVSRLSDIG